jgi:hypothetical protein
LITLAANRLAWFAWRWNGLSWSVDAAQCQGRSHRAARSAAPDAQPVNTDALVHDTPDHLEVMAEWLYSMRDGFVASV